MMFYLFIGFLEEIVSGESRSNTYNVLCETDSCNPDTFYQNNFEINIFLINVSIFNLTLG